MLDTTLFSAFLAGLVTFLAPCTLPLLPGYLAFIGGGSHLRKNIMRGAVLFVLGFSVVFIVYGVASGALGKFLILYRNAIVQVGGFIIMLIGISLLDVITLPQFFASGKSFRLPKWAIPGSSTGAFLLGFLFALGWSPCLGPVLGTILLLAGAGGTPLYGGFLLGVYSLGLAVPFLLIALFYGSVFASLPTLTLYLPLIRKVSGLIIVGLGLLLVLGQFAILSTWVSDLVGTRFFDALFRYM
jgi:cytochrome c-type biogenesis protein